MKGLGWKNGKNILWSYYRGGVEGRVVMCGRGSREEGEEEMDINREEVREAIKRLKDGKALG